MINIIDNPDKRHRFERHYGEIVELTIRKSGYSITELARIANCNRRTVYNWFTQRHLSVQIIYRIGVVLKHDYSKEFPELFTKEDFEGISAIARKPAAEPNVMAESTDHFWKDRYITLLENYNKMLSTMQAIKEERLSA